MKTKPKPATDTENDFGELDPHNLIEEWSKQDRLVGFYGDKLAKAKRKYEELQSAAEVFEAETARRIRRRPKRYGVIRITEAALKEVVLVELLTSDVHIQVMDAKYQVNMLENAMRRLEHRKKALSDFVYLHGQGYYAAKMNVPKKYKERMKDSQIRGLRNSNGDDED